MTKAWTLPGQSARRPPRLRPSGPTGEMALLLRQRPHLRSSAERLAWRRQFVAVARAAGADVSAGLGVDAPAISGDLSWDSDGLGIYKARGPLGHRATVIRTKAGTHFWSVSDPRGGQLAAGSQPTLEGAKRVAALACPGATPAPTPPRKAGRYAS